MRDIEVVGEGVWVGSTELWVLASPDYPAFRSPR